MPFDRPRVTHTPHLTCRSDQSCRKHCRVSDAGAEIEDALALADSYRPDPIARLASMRPDQRRMDRQTGYLGLAYVK